MTQTVAPSAPFHTGLVTRGQAIAMLSGAAIMLVIAMGVRQSLGLFQTPVVQDLGIAAADFAMAIAVQNIVWGFTQPVAGAFTDRYGPRWIALVGVVIYIAGLVDHRDGDQPGHDHARRRRADRHRAVVHHAGIASNIAARVIVPARRSLALRHRVGRRIDGHLLLPRRSASGDAATAAGGRALVAFIIVALLMLPAAFIGGRAERLPNSSARDADLTLLGALDEARRHGGYVVMSLAFFVCGLQLVFLTTHLPSYLVLCGMDPLLGAQALAVIGLFNVIGSWGCGWLGDRYRKRTLLGMVYLIRSVVIAAYFMLPVTPTSTLIFAALMGLTWLGVIPLLNGIVVEIFGIKFLSTLTGIAFFSHQVGSFLGAWGGGAIFDALGSYDRALQFGVIVGLIAGLAQILMDDRPTERISAAVPEPGR